MIKKVNIVLFFAIISQVITVWQLYTMNYRKQGGFLVKPLKKEYIYYGGNELSLIPISEPTRLGMIKNAVF